MCHFAVAKVSGNPDDKYVFKSFISWKRVYETEYKWEPLYLPTGDEHHFITDLEIIFTHRAVSELTFCC